MIRLFSITPPTVGFSVFSATAAAETSTVSVSSPTGSLEVLAHLGPCFHAKSLHRFGLKPLHFALDVVVADEDRREGVVSGFIGLDALRHTHPFIGNRHLGAGNHRAAGVCNQSLNRLRALRQKGTRIEDQECEQTNKRAAQML